LSGIVPFHKPQQLQLLYHGYSKAYTVPLFFFFFLYVALIGDDLQDVHLGSRHHGSSVRLSDYTADRGTSQAIPC